MNILKYFGLRGGTRKTDRVLSASELASRRWGPVVIHVVETGKRYSCWRLNGWTLIADGREWPDADLAWGEYGFAWYAQDVSGL